MDDGGGIMPVVVVPWWWWWWHPRRGGGGVMVVVVVVYPWWWHRNRNGGGVMSAWDSTCRGRDLIRSIVREAADDHVYDPWGSGMAALIVLSDAAFWIGLEVDPSVASPAPSWEPGGDWIQAEEHESAWELIVAIREGQASTDDLDLGIRYVDRYLNLPAVNAQRY